MLGRYLYSGFPCHNNVALRVHLFRSSLSTSFVTIPSIPAAPDTTHNGLLSLSTDFATREPLGLSGWYRSGFSTVLTESERVMQICAAYGEVRRRATDTVSPPAEAPSIFKFGSWRRCSLDPDELSAMNAERGAGRGGTWRTCALHLRGRGSRGVGQSEWGAQRGACVRGLVLPGRPYTDKHALLLPRAEASKNWERRRRRRSRGPGCSLGVMRGHRVGGTETLYAASAEDARARDAARLGRVHASGRARTLS